MSKLFVVFCMDTEGPCDDPGNSELLKDWKEVDFAMDKLFSEDFRSKYRDSKGNKFKIGWFFLTWSGFITNPRNRDFGYHKVRDHYLNRWGRQIESYGDEECWHYHHPPRSGIGNEWSSDWSSSCEYQTIISRQIIERSWFPICFRAGGTIMDKNLSQWVDKWFPFDYTNRAPLKFPEMDWSDGINSWQPYAPDPVKFKKKGSGNRLMARCMDLLTGTSELSDEDIIQAFEEATTEGKAIISVFDHDYRDIEKRICNFLNKLQKFNKDFEDVKLEYKSPSEAIAQYLPSQEGKKLRLSFNSTEGKFQIETNKDIHQNIPWIAMEDKKGLYSQIERGVNKISASKWEINKDNFLNAKRIGIAVSNNNMETDVLTIDK